MAGQKTKKLKFLFGVVGLIFLLFTITSSSNDLILHLTVRGWGGFGYGGSIKTYLISTDNIEKFYSSKENVFNKNFTFVKKENDSLVILKIKSLLVVAGMALKSENNIQYVDVTFDTTILRTTTVCAGTDYSLFIDTTELARSIVENNSAPIIEITEIDFPTDRVYSKEVLHPNGKIKQKWTEKHNERFRRVKDGIYEEWSINGVLLTRVNFSIGQFDGDFLQFYPNGTKKIKGSYKNNKKDGTWIFYDTYGEITAQGKYLNGSGGLFYPNGNIKTEELRDTLINKVSYILWDRTWYKNGQLKYEKYYSDSIMTVRAYWLNGDEITGKEKYSYRKDIFQFSPMNLSRPMKTRNNHDSLETAFYSNNHLKQKASFDEDGNLTKIKYWYQNGQLSQEKKYKNGNLKGFWKSWDSKGKLLQTKEYSHKDSAYVKIYQYESDQIMMQGKMFFGLNEGDWEVFNNDGSLYSIISYKNGKQISVDIK